MKVGFVVFGVERRSAAGLAALTMLGIVGCGGDAGTAEEAASACEYKVAGVRTCQEVRGSAATSGECQGTPLPKCPSGSTASCTAKTNHGTYVFYAYGGADQADLDAQCKALTSGGPAEGGMPSTPINPGDCSWSARGDGTTNAGDADGSCLTPSLPSAQFLEFASPVPRAYGAREVGLFSLSLNLEGQVGPFSCTAATAKAQGLSRFAIEARSLEHAGTTVGRWKCDHSRSTTTGTFTIAFSELVVTDGKIERYAGTVDAVCPPSTYEAAYPAVGIMTFHVDFSGP